MAANVDDSKLSTAKANGQFTVKLYHELTTKDKVGNLFFSPYSISSAMSMVLLGCKGQSLNELKAGLGYGEFGGDLDEIHEDNGKMQEAILATENITLDAANRLFVEKSYQLLEEYVAKCNNYYSSEASNLNFQGEAEKSRKTINDWVSDKTKQKIKDILPPGTITADTKLVLANAVYFKGKWASTFDEKKTKPGNFYLIGGKKVKVQMMNKVVHCCYEDLGSVQVLELPYKGKEVVLAVVLPKKREGLDNLEKVFTYEELAKWDALKYSQAVDVFLPRFKMEFGTDLIQHFRDLGVLSIFGDKADLSGISGCTDLCVTSIIHKAFIEVNEEGTEAAAATVVSLKTKSLFGGKIKPPKFICDHPFLFFIKHKPTNTILFTGRVLNPEPSA